METLTPILISTAFAVLCAFGAWVLAELRRKLKGETYAKLFDQLERLTTMIVLELDQTVVQRMKQEAADGKLPKEVAASVKDVAVTRLLQLVNDQNDPLRKAFGEAIAASATTLATMVEAKVRQIRLAQQGRMIK